MWGIDDVRFGIDDDGFDVCGRAGGTIGWCVGLIVVFEWIHGIGLLLWVRIDCHMVLGLLDLGFLLSSLWGKTKIKRRNPIAISK